MLHVSQPTTAGVAGVVENLVADQVQNGWDVVVACPAQGSLADATRMVGARIHTWPAIRRVGPELIGETRRLSRLITTVQPDVLHLHSAKAGLAGRLAVRGRMPTLFQPHAWSFEAASGPQYPTALAWERAAARWTQLIICVSEHERRRGQLMGIDAPMAVVPNGVDLAHFRGRGDLDRIRTRRRLGLPEGPLVVCVGRLCRQKGQDVLLAAWRQVGAVLPAAQLVLVGDGPDRERLNRHRPPSVIFAGAVADPEPWYTAADVVVLPSRWEAMPLVLLEAMACRRCVVATDVGGVREVLRVRGAGVVPVEDGPALADALLVRLTRPELAEAEGTTNRLQIVSAHDRDQVRGRVRQLYDDLLDGSRRRQDTSRTPETTR